MDILLIFAWITIGVVIHTVLVEDSELMVLCVIGWPLVVIVEITLWWIILVERVTKSIKNRISSRRNKED